MIISVANKDNIDNVVHDHFDYSKDWYLEDGKPADFSELSGTTTVTATLPKLKDDHILYFNAKTLNVSVYIEGECIYKSINYDPNLFGKTSGSYYVRIPLHSNLSGKEISMVLENPYNDNSGKITQMQIGNGIHTLVDNIRDRIFSLCINIIIIFIGIAFIALYIPMWKYNAVGKELLYFGFFALCIGIYMITDSKLLQELFMNAHIYHIISEMFMMLFIVPMFLFFESMYHSSPRSKKILNTVCIVSLIDFVISYLLAITGIMDYHQTIRLTHFSYILAIIALIVLTLINLKKKENINTYHTIGIITFCIFGLVDIVLWNTASFTDTAFFTRIGVLSFMCFEAVQLISLFLKNYVHGMHSKFLEKLAYQDGLTNLLNRTSYMDDLKILEKDTENDVLIAFYDINNLKPINDNHGHSYGDKMVVLVSEVLNKHLSHFGKCYRIGGDEFVFIATGDNIKENFLHSQECIRKEFKNENKRNTFPFKISVACGYAIWEDKDLALSDVIDLADENMYMNKKEMKEKYKQI